MRETKQHIHSRNLYPNFLEILKSRKLEINVFKKTWDKCFLGICLQLLRWSDVPYIMGGINQKKKMVIYKINFIYLPGIPSCSGASTSSFWCMIWSKRFRNSIVFIGEDTLSPEILIKKHSKQKQTHATIEWISIIMN